jgi:hypothetical protein
MWTATKRDFGQIATDPGPSQPGFSDASRFAFAVKVLSQGASANGNKQLMSSGWALVPIAALARRVAGAGRFGRRAPRVGRVLGAALVPIDSSHKGVAVIMQTVAIIEIA